MDWSCILDLELALVREKFVKPIFYRFRFNDNFVVNPFDINNVKHSTNPEQIGQLFDNVYSASIVGLLYQSSRHFTSIFRRNSHMYNRRTILHRAIGNIWNDAKGGAAIIVVAGAPLVIGGLTLSVETGVWYLGQRQVQQQADTAALGVARTISDGTTTKGVLEAVASHDAERNGATPTELTVNYPPLSGKHAGSSTAVEVIVKRNMKSLFAQFFGIGSTTVTGRAVAQTLPKNSANGGCVLALDIAAAKGLQFQGSGVMNAESCTLVSNSKASDSVYVGGSETLKAQTVLASGGMEVGSSSTVSVPNIYTYQQGGTDPYANLAMPTAGICTHTNYSKSSGGTATPGVYCGGMSISGSQTLDLAPGTYVMKGGDFKVTGSASVTCTGCMGGLGVTIVLAPGSNGYVGTVMLGGSTSVQFPAPSKDTYYDGVNLRGIAVLQDRSATYGNAAKFDGSGNLKISGAIYMASADVTWIGTSDLLVGYACVEIIGRTVNVQGNSKLSLTDCEAMGVPPVKVKNPIALLE